MASHFLTKTQIDLDSCVRIGDEIALESFPALRAFLETRASPQAARLFAEPLISRGNREAPATISWYSDLEGEAVPITQLDEQARSDIDSKIASRLAGLRELLSDPDGGRLIGAALHLPKLSDIWAIQGEPVILNWGMLSSAGDTGETARATQYKGTLGRYLPLAVAPPLTAVAQSALAETSAKSASATTAETEIAPETEATEVTGSDTTPPVTPPVDPTPPRERRGPALEAVIPLVILLLIAAGVLIWLLVPGNRFFPARNAVSPITEAEAVRIAAGVNADLIERRNTLRRALAEATCKADGTLLMPDGLTIEGLAPPIPGQPGAAPGSRVAAAPNPTLPPAVERVQLGPDGDSYVEHIEARTGMVVNAVENGGTGSGFFVSPDLFLTNEHVVRNSQPGSVFVVMESLGGRRPATVLRSMGPFTETGGDFALLRVEGADQKFFQIANTQQSLKLQSVVAAGYPGDILQTDAAFQALVRGNSTAVPDMSLTTGTVSTEQNMGNLANVVIHSAPISTGNSGGPLIDNCGRVVGINTLVRKGALRNLPVAIASSEILEFLAASGAQPTVVTSVCTPQVLRPEAPPATPAEQ